MHKYMYSVVELTEIMHESSINGTLQKLIRVHVHCILSTCTVYLVSVIIALNLK